MLCVGCFNLGSSRATCLRVKVLDILTRRLFRYVTGVDINGEVGDTYRTTILMI